MKLNIIILLVLFVGFTSCKSVRKIAASDNSTSTKKAKNRKRNIEFIEGIEVSPGNIVKSKHGTIAHTSTAKIKVPDYIKNVNYDAAALVEKATPLQWKYAIQLNANIDSINNIPLLQKIEEWWGTSYCLGGSTKNCIDCSSFSRTILKDVYNIEIPRTAAEQYQACEKVDREFLQEGDLVFFHTYNSGVSHVGVYLHNNKFVHAATSGGVMISDLNESYWRGRFIGAGKVRR